MNIKALILARLLFRRGTVAAITATLVTTLMPGVGAAQSGAVAHKVSLRSSNEAVMKPVIQTLTSRLLRTR